MQRQTSGRPDRGSAVSTHMRPWEVFLPDFLSDGPVVLGPWSVADPSGEPVKTQRLRPMRVEEGWTCAFFLGSPGILMPTDILRSPVVGLQLDVAFEQLGS